MSEDVFTSGRVLEEQTGTITLFDVSSSETATFVVRHYPSQGDEASRVHQHASTYYIEVRELKDAIALVRRVPRGAVMVWEDDGPETEGTKGGHQQELELGTGASAALPTFLADGDRVFGAGDTPADCWGTSRGAETSSSNRIRNSHARCRKNRRLRFFLNLAWASSFPPPAAGGSTAFDQDRFDDLVLRCGASFDIEDHCGHGEAAAPASLHDSGPESCEDAGAAEDPRLDADILFPSPTSCNEAGTSTFNPPLRRMDVEYLYLLGLDQHSLEVCELFVRTRRYRKVLTKSNNRGALLASLLLPRQWLRQHTAARGICWNMCLALIRWYPVYSDGAGHRVPLSSSVGVDTVDADIFAHPNLLRRAFLARRTGAAAGAATPVECPFAMELVRREYDLCTTTSDRAAEKNIPADNSPPAHFLHPAQLRSSLDVPDCSTHLPQDLCNQSDPSGASHKASSFHGTSDRNLSDLDDSGADHDGPRPGFAFVISEAQLNARIPNAGGLPVFVWLAQRGDFHLCEKLLDARGSDVDVDWCRRGRAPAASVVGECERQGEKEISAGSGGGPEAMDSTTFFGNDSLGDHKHAEQSDDSEVEHVAPSSWVSCDLNDGEDSVSPPALWWLVFHAVKRNSLRSVSSDELPESTVPLEESDATGDQASILINKSAGEDVVVSIFTRTEYRLCRRLLISMRSHGALTFRCGDEVGGGGIDDRGSNIWDLLWTQRQQALEREIMCLWDARVEQLWANSVPDAIG